MLTDPTMRPRRRPRRIRRRQMALSLLLDRYDPAGLDTLVEILEKGVSVSLTPFDTGEVYFDLIKEKKLTSPAVFAFIDWHLVHDAALEGLISLADADITYALQAAIGQGYAHPSVRECMGFMSSLQATAARGSDRA